MGAPGQERFITSAGDGILVSAWSVPRDRAEGDVETWVQAYCERTGNKPCAGIADRAVPLCLERADCHPGLLVPFDDDVQAFFTPEDVGSPITVVAVWWGESAPATQSYGGSRKLLEAFLLTMNVRPEPSADPSVDPLDTSLWETYESARYGFTIGHPGDWDVVPATRDWTFDADGRDGMISPAQEAFAYPGGSSGIRVSAWSVPRALAEGDLEAWVQAYCERTGNKPCTGIADRAVPICFESPDCHPGVLVPFDDDVQAFLTLDDMGAPVTVVAVWWGESAPATAPYGGSRKLLEAFLKTMDSRPLP